MCTLYENIRQLCKEKGVSGSKMCLDLGISKSTLSDIKGGRKKGVSVPTAQKIAAYFGVSVDELYGIKETKKATDKYDGLSENAIKLIECVKDLPEEKIRLLLEDAKSF